MARIQRDAKLETREARKKLKAKHEPYWRTIHQGLAIGYRKSATRAGIWKARKPGGDKYVYRTIGRADDFDDANGVDVFDYKDAHGLAMAFGNAEILPERDITIGQAIDEYLANYILENKPKEKTLNTTRAMIKKHIDPLAKRVINELTFNDLKRWRNSLVKIELTDEERHDPELVYERTRKRQATANRIQTYLKAALNFAFEHHDSIRSNSAWLKLKPFKNVDADNIRPLSTDECQRLLNACDPDFRLLVRAALYTGCRYGELINMKVSDFDSGTRRVNVSKRIAKSSKTRQIPLNDDGYTYFLQQVVGKTGDSLIFMQAGKSPLPWASSMQKRRMDAACVAAKISPMATFHNLRDTYASLLVSSGVPIKAVADLLGHSDTRITERCYAKFQQSEKDYLIKEYLPSFGIEKSNVEAIK